MTSSFGTLPDGDPVTGVRISAGRLRASILSWGATLQDLRFDPADNRSDIPLVLGFDSIDDYLVHGRFHGAAVGRVINRRRCQRHDRLRAPQARQRQRWRSHA